jgi:subtilisin family serine protease
MFSEFSFASEKAMLSNDEYSDPGNCSSYVTVVTIDTGVDTRNKKLAKYLKKDGFGSIVGWQTGGLRSFEDENGHGTHVAGIIAKEAECVKIVPISYWHQKDVHLNKTSNFVEALNYSLVFKPRIINVSGGGSLFTVQEYNALKEIEKRGILVVAAAGNEGEDIDIAENNYFPSSYDFKNIISVAAVDGNGTLSEKSNYGVESVDLAAMGVRVRGFGLNEKMVYLTGTSQATAEVSGLAARLINLRPDLTNNQLKNIILETVDKKSRLYNKLKSGGILNKNRAISRLLDLEYY